MMGSIPSQIRACDENNITPIYGIEFYLQDRHPPKDIFDKMTSKEKKDIRKSYHLLAIAFNNTGYSNLVQLSSWAWTNGFYYKPRVTHEQLLKHKEGVIFTSCCYNGEIGQAFDKHGEDAACEMIEKYHHQFGENFYLELMMLDFDKQKPFNKFLIKAYDKYKIPLILSQDAHYPEAEDSKYQRYMLMIQQDTSIKEIEKKLSLEDKADIFELQDSNLWMKSERELNEKWLAMYQADIPYDLYIQAKKNTIEICNKAKNVKIDRGMKLPFVPDAELKLKEAIIEGATYRCIHKNQKYISRLKEEYELICRKGFASYFLIQKKMTDEARRICPNILGWGDGSEAVGCGRGCLSGDTKIIVGKGLSKSLKDVEVGDLVVCKDGISRPVINRFEYDVKENLLNICCYYGDGKGVTLTKDHKVLVEKLKYARNNDKWAESTKRSRRKIQNPTGILQWVRTDDLNEGDWVFVPRPESKINNLDNVDLSIFCSDKENTYFDENYVYQDRITCLKAFRKKKKVKRIIELDEEWHIIFGLFAGDGWTVSTRNVAIGFAFNSETNIESMKILIKKLDEIEVDYFIKKATNGKKLVQIFINNKIIHNWFKSMFCRYKCTSQTKHIPDFIFTQKEKYKYSYLKGYMFSDGNCTYATKCTYTTTSLELASQTRFLCWQLGIPASLGHFDRFDKRSGKNSVGFTLNIPHVQEISGKNSIIKNTYRKIDSGFLFRIRKIKEVSGIEKVHDIRVENEHNYLTSSFIVHNSCVSSLVCYCLRITDVDPIRHDLLFSRFLSESRGGRSMRLKFK